MKRKSLFLRLLAIVMMTTASINFVACGGDDSGESTEGDQFWITGTVRGYLLEIGLDFRVSTSGDTVDPGATISCPLTTMEVIVFRKDLTALYYSLTNTEHASAINDLCLKNGKSRIAPFYDGTWMTLTSYPEWSYFNGKIINPDFESEVKNPQKLTYSVNTSDNSITILDEGGKLWKVLYINFNASKTSWSELRDSEGNLSFHIWSSKEPLDNSRFTAGK